MAVQIQLRHDTAANWAAVNPTLAQGEPGLETDTGKLKFGNGAGAWNSLPYFSGTSATRYGTTIFTIDGAATTVTGKLRIYNKSGLTRTIVRVWACANTAPTGQALTVDIHKSATTIFTNQANRPTIAAGENYGDTTTVGVSSWSDGEYLTMDVDAVGSIVAGSDVTVGIEYTY
jgi:hypothetical protein